MSTTVFGIRITLDDKTAPVAQDTSIGLYNVSGDNSEFRWLQNQVSGVTNWDNSMLVKNGIGKWGREIELTEGGNVADPVGTIVRVKNTGQFNKDLDDSSIYLIGKKIEIVEYFDATSIVRWTGLVEQVAWDSVVFEISAKGAFYTAREAVLGTELTEGLYPNSGERERGKVLGPVIGKVDKCAFWRTVKTDEIETIIWRYFFADTLYFVGDPSSTSVFPVVGTAKMIENVTAGTDTVKVDMADGFRAGDTVTITDRNNTTEDLEVDSVDTVIHTVTFTTNLVNTYAAENGDNVILENTSGSRQLLIRLTEGGFWTGGSDRETLTNLLNKRIQVAFGTGGSQTRTIEDAKVFILGRGIEDSEVSILVNKFWETELVKSRDATDENTTWVQITNVDRQFVADTWNMNNFIDADGATTSSDLQVFNYDADSTVVVPNSDTEQTLVVDIDDENYKRVSQYAYQGAITSNSIDLNESTILDSPDVNSNFIIAPVENVSKYSGSTLEDWDVFGYNIKVANGVFADRIDSFAYTETGSLDNTVDKNVDTEYQINITTNFSGALALDFTFPEIADDFEFDEVYLILDVKTNLTSTPFSIGGTLSLIWGRFIGTLTNILSDYDGRDIDNINKDAFIRCIPDFYYNGNSGEEYFLNQNPITLPTDKIYGYKRFKLEGVDSVEKYRSITRLALIYNQVINLDDSGGATGTLDLRIREIAVMFKRKQALKNPLYISVLGRNWTVSDSIATRFTADDYIDKPIDFLEYICRLQNGQENDTPPADGWGKGYWENALIKTSGDGSFDSTDPDLLSLDSLKISWQPFSLKDTYTTTLKRRLCREFQLGNWVDADGSECVKRIVKSSTSPSDALTLNDIVDRSQIKITLPDSRRVFVEPFVNYDYDPGSKEYKKQIRFTNTDQSTYASGYVEGLSGETAQEYWERLQTIRNKTKILRVPPGDYTDLWFANGDDADTIAQEYITQWIDWMYNIQISFPVHYNTVKGWEECRRFSISLPHQTNNVAVECILTGIYFDPNPPYHAEVSAIMYSETIPEDFNLQDTMTALTGNFDRLDDMEVYTERGSTGLDDQQDAM